MGFRIRKTIKILPGIKINLSNTGISTTIGGRGASVNIKSGRKTKTTIGIPGTGISHTSYLGSDTRRVDTVSPRPSVEDSGTPRSSGRPNIIIGIGCLIALGLVAKACSSLG